MLKRRLTLASVAVVVAAIGLVAAVLVSWLHSAAPLHTVGTTEQRHLTIGQSFYGELGAYPSPSGTARTVDVRSVVPAITTNTARAEISVLVCVRNARPLPASISVLDIRPYCAGITKFRPGRLRLGPGATELIVAATPHRAGLVQIDGAHLSLRDGIRSGHQHVGVAMTTTTVLPTRLE